MISSPVAVTLSILSFFALMLIRLGDSLGGYQDLIDQFVAPTTAEN